jgi:hypothetical protein
MTQTTLRGSCLCGSVQYEITGTPTRFYHCHCSRCRKSSGTGHASNLFLQPATIRWLKGEELLRTFRPPEAKRFTRQFCGNSGSGVARQVKDSDAVIAPAGSLDNEPPIKPQARIFWDSRVSWSCSGDGIQTYPESAT